MLSRRANTGWMDGKLCAPGGHVEAGETPTQAMIREIEEELGVIVKAIDLEFLCVAVRNTSPTEYVAYEFVIRDKPYKYVNNETDKCGELVWVDPNNLPDDHHRRLQANNRQVAGWWAEVSRTRFLTKFILLFFSCYYY
jgi:8-oxo-dGTP diphosphatase